MVEMYSWNVSTTHCDNSEASSNRSSEKGLFASCSVTINKQLLEKNKHFASKRIFFFCDKTGSFWFSAAVNEFPVEIFG